MKKLFFAIFLLVSSCASAQVVTSKEMEMSENLRGVSMIVGNSMGFINWIRTDTSVYIIETFLDEDSCTSTNYWWMKKKNGKWQTNLPGKVCLYLDGTKSLDISWMNLPMVDKKTRSLTNVYLDFTKMPFSYLEYGPSSLKN